MKKDENIFLTPSQFTFTLVSAMVGSTVISLPNVVIKAAKQDGWIGCILGAVYPIYMFILANYICKKFPKDNILVLSKKCFGRFLGNIFNYIFILFFLFIDTVALSAFIFMFRTYAIFFLKNYQALMAILVVVAYIAYKGMKALGRLNEVVFYLTIMLVFIPIGSLVYGNILNLEPVFSSGLSSIFKASKETALAYSGMELIFLIYPFLQDNKKIMKCGMWSTAISGFIYTWFTLLTIYYLGIEISPKYLWPVLSLSDSIRIPIINNFRFIFISLWAFIALKCAATHYFAVSYSLNQQIKKISAPTFCLVLYPIILWLTSLYHNPTTRADFIDKVIPMYVIFNLIYVSSICFLIIFKKGDINEQN